MRRTIIEWRSMRYGEADTEIPDWAAHRLAQVAKASPLGGEDGGRIFTHGRHEIRARQIVGILAAEGVSLEILPKIDFAGGGADVEGRTRRCLVTMLAIAMDIEIASGLLADIDWQKETLLEIVVRLFVLKLSDEVRRGMPRRYVSLEDDLPTLRGRLDLKRQFTRLAVRPGTLACRYEELSPDIVLNQIMKATVERLMRVSRSAENLRRLRELSFFYADLAPVQVEALAWDKLQLDRTNSRWRELVTLARLLLGERFQTTSSGGGRGFSLLFEMSSLFESYVAQLLKRALRGSPGTVHIQGGRLYCLQEVGSGSNRFMTKPDILIREGGQVRMIIDTKWKRISRVTDDPKRGVSQSDVYQMMAYAKLYGSPQLILLYPHHDELGEKAGIVSRHRINQSSDELSIATLNLIGDCSAALQELVQGNLTAPGSGAVAA